MKTFNEPTQESTLELEPKLVSNQKYQFWTLQFSGWFSYTVIVFLAIIKPQFNDANFNLIGQIQNLTVEVFSGFMLAYLQWLLIQRIVHFPVKKTLAISFSSAALLGFVYNIIKLASFKVLVYQQSWNESWNMLEFGGWLLFSISTMFIWTSIFFILLYNAKLQREHELLLRAQTATKDAQLQMLRYQLNPHFMFNTMNAISTLIYKNENDKANDMLEKLCDFFRYSLDKNSTSSTTLLKELALLELYLSIEKVRFGEKLHVSIDIPPALLSYQLPSLLLQPLVENAVKHAIEPQKDHGMIAISAQIQAQRLLLNVSDNGPSLKVKSTEGFGIGMTNTKARLDAMFNGDYSINIEDKNTGGTSVSISIPLQK